MIIHLVFVMVLMLMTISHDADVIHAVHAQHHHYLTCQTAPSPSRSDRHHHRAAMQFMPKTDQQHDYVELLRPMLGHGRCADGIFEWSCVCDKRGGGKLTFG